MSGLAGGGAQAAACEAVAERLEAYHYRDLEPDELGTIEAHVEACGHCRATLEAVAETAAGLDRLPVPVPTAAEWARFEAKLEARVAPLRAERLATKAARGRAALPRGFGFRRAAAAVLVAGLGALAGGLFLETRSMKAEMAGLQAELLRARFAEGDVQGVKDLLLTVADPRIAAALPKIEGDSRPLRLYNLARIEVHERQRDLLLQILADHPRHWLADQAFAALQKRGDATPPALDVAALAPVPVVARPLPGVPAAEHYAAEVERLKRLGAAEGDIRFRAYALFRAARVAEEELQDRERAAREFRGVLAAAPPGAIREAAEERLRGLEGRR